MDEIQGGLSQVQCDVLVLGGGTAGPMAAIRARRKNPKGERHPARKGQREAVRRHLHGNGRT